MSVAAVFTGIGRFCVRFRWAVLLLWIVGAVLAATQLPALSSVLVNLPIKSKLRVIELLSG